MGAFSVRITISVNIILFVAPRFLGQGIGRALIGHALKLKGELLLEVYTDNAQAVSFYEDLGFRELSRRTTKGEGLPVENAKMHLVG